MPLSPDEQRILDEIEQRLAEVQIHETASPRTANGHELFQIVELDRDSRFV